LPSFIQDYSFVSKIDFSTSPRPKRSLPKIPSFPLQNTESTLFTHTPIPEKIEVKLEGKKDGGGMHDEFEGQSMRNKGKKSSPFNPFL